LGGYLILLKISSSCFLNISKIKNHPFWVLGKISQRITYSIYYKKFKKPKKFLKELVVLLVDV